eukprot:8417105-Pyramimonas_sp.AAC.1
MTYISVLKTKRFVWISDKFIDLNPTCAAIILGKIAQSNGKWKTVVSKADILVKANKASTRSQALACASLAEQQLDELGNVRVKLALREIPIWFANLDARG